MSLLDDFDTIVAKQRNSKEYIMEHWLHTCTRREKVFQYVEPQYPNVIYYYLENVSRHTLITYYSVYAMVDGEMQVLTLTLAELYRFLTKFDKLKQ